MPRKRPRPSCRGDTFPDRHGETLADMDDARRAELGLTPELLARIERRVAYLITHRHRPHERGTLVWFCLLTGCAFTRDIAEAAEAVHRYWHSQEGTCCLGREEVRFARDGLEALGPRLPVRPGRRRQERADRVAPSRRRAPQGDDRRQPPPP
ncbi:hypothetical protein [Parvularcula oceani]|uniref:hypothetical protein n=1 Tax=Parvularcula oceani TaxID=1247963 RepID=UPI0004E13359|nr:hypothetical protein [Parvularcula oceani]